ncbi:peptidoglycan-binding protein LysM [Kangiella sp. HZ709]|uniref:peptidoglycan-binding protein LysM n=1 Tax=Kangiella sp. HZ709 TaxID=2666328 RepID=UPI0012B0F5B7|nr:peptidoglycan-binding protein LysM [Kangiella sp. HZ709]MRX28428.1 peptidoglycan-binding protein LysM [Kangiella sp. HZ709]
MGLFDFAFNMGKKMFGKDDDAPTEIKKHIEEDNPGVEDLNIEMNEDGKVVMTGKASSADAVEKAVLMAGNAEGVTQVDTSGVEAPEQEKEVEFYEIQKGDTLWAISQKFLGNGARYTEIFDANKEVIKNPDLIYPGQTIRIPLD